jgi:hypothetical protein
MERESRIPREPEDPMPPSKPVADGMLLLGSPGEEGLKIGEYVDGSGGLDLALLDESWVSFLSIALSRLSHAPPSHVADPTSKRTPSHVSNDKLGDSRSTLRTKSGNRDKRVGVVRVGGPARASSLIEGRWQDGRHTIWQKQMRAH